MKSKNRVSLVIPTKNRHLLLDRALNHLKKINCTYPIIIADNSISAFKHIDKYEEILNIKYFFTDLDGWEKQNFFVSKVETPYVLILGDDDFIVLESVEKAINFLDANIDYVCAADFEVKFIENEKKLQFFIANQPSLQANNYLKRIRKHCQSFFSTFYFIHRRDSLLKSLSLAMRNISLESVALEILVSLSIVGQGKIKVLSKDLFMLRQVGHSKTTVIPQWDDLLKGKNSDKIKLAIINVLYDFFQTNSQVDKKSIEASYDFYIKNYISLCNPPKYKSNKYFCYIRDLILSVKGESSKNQKLISRANNLLQENNFELYQ